MALMWKGIGICLICSVLSLSLKDRGKDFSVLLGIGACVGVSVIALSYLEPVISFFRRLETIGSLDAEYLTILIKVVGIGSVTDLAAQFCADSGNAGVGKVLQFLGTAVMVWTSVPVFDALLELVCSVLGGI